MTEENELKKDYLRQYQQAVRQMQRLELKIRELRLSKMCPTVINDGMPHASSHSDLSAYAAILDEEERRYMKARYQRIKCCRDISNRIESMANEDEKDVLMYRYIKLLKWEDICAAMRKSWKQVHRFHSKALNNFKMGIE